MKETNFDLRGKDWFNEPEAAHYCGVSFSHFSAHSRHFKQTRRFLGKKLYSKAELDDAITQSEKWYPEPRTVAYVPSFHGDERMQKIWDRVSNPIRRPYKARKKT